MSTDELLPVEASARAEAPADRRRVSTVTLVTQLRPLGLLHLGALFALTKVWPKRLGMTPLRSVFFTRWSILVSLPHNGPPQLRERPHPPYLLWQSVYSAEMEPYIESFVASVGRQIDVTWNTSYGYPGTGSITRLREYIESLLWCPSCEWCAYPNVTVRTVLSSLAVVREHRFLLEAADQASPEEFTVVYEGFLRRRQADL